MLDSINNQDKQNKEFKKKLKSIKEYNSENTNDKTEFNKQVARIKEILQVEHNTINKNKIIMEGHKIDL